jgi:hypothetical protein
MRERREKGLCYNCDEEKWIPSLKCNSHTLYLLRGTKSITEDNVDEDYIESIDKSDQ